jgi:amino acid adenylation domain-containing protein
MIDIEYIYPLSPMQKGMLFHTLLHPETGVYFEQFHCTVRGDLHLEAFQRAWRYAVYRHAVLRTAFNWEQLDRPFQLVHRRVELPWEIKDWRGLPEAQRPSRLEAYLEADRRRGFQLQQPPLMRLALFRLSEDTYHWIWSHHHALLDGWSSPLLLAEIFNCYQAFAGGSSPQLPPVRPYLDYIAWLQRQDSAKAECYWRQALKGFHTPTTLRLARKSGSDPEPEGDYAVERLWLSEQATRQLQALAQRQRLTLHTLVQGAWAILLSRYSGATDVVFGTTVSGRSPEIAGVEEIIGLIINTLPTRVTVPSGERVVPWLSRLQQQQAEARQYDYRSLADIQGWSDVPRGTPLFETIFVFENYPIERALTEAQARFERGGLEVRDFRTFERTNYPLTALVTPSREMLLGAAYETNRFDAAAIRRLLGHWQTILEGMATDPEQRIGDLPLLAEGEVRTVLVEWNSTSAAAPPAGCVHEWFDAQAARTPDAIAVVGEQGCLTYRQIQRQANGLARRLRQAGVRPEVRVGMCLERSRELAVALLAVLKAGGAYVPLDPAYPQERLDFLLADCQAPVLLTQTKLRERLPQYAGQIVFLDGEPVPSADSSLEVSVLPDNLAYVIYTSGSTGQPKGVMMTHGCLCNLLQWQLTDPCFAPGRRTLQFASASFDVSFQELFSTWLSGGTLFLVGEDVRRDSACLLRFITEHRVERLFLPFVALRHLAEAGVAAELHPAALREVITAGEQLQIAPSIASWLDRLDGCTLQNQYGPSESHVVTAFTLNGPPENWPKLPPIGKSITNGRVYVLDSDLRPVPIGVPGELWIGGTALGRGYLYRPDLTADRFLPDPYSAQRGARMYKTGDVARFASDGNLEFLGRCDDQVKIRGFRVEPGEVEAALRRHPQVTDCAVRAYEDETAQRRLIAYVVSGTAAPICPGDLRCYLSDRLPEYLVPALYVPLDGLPLTPSGKLDRRALPAPSTTRRAPADSFVAPDGPLERVLVGIWSEVLKIDPVGRHDDFIELGGDSLLSLQVVSRIRATLQVEVPLRALFDHPTVAGLAETLRRDPDSGESLERVAEMVLSLAGLSDAEVEALLAERTS